MNYATQGEKEFRNVMGQEALGRENHIGTYYDLIRWASSDTHHNAPSPVILLFQRLDSCFRARLKCIM